MDGLFQVDSRILWFGGADDDDIWGGCGFLIHYFCGYVGRIDSIIILYNECS